MRIKLVTFSDGSFALRAAGRRLVKQADSTGWFDHQSEHWTAETLLTKMPDFYSTHQKFIEAHQKGFGLWVWKPAILSYLIENLEDDEMVLLLDAGCQLNSNEDSRLRFQQYIEICKGTDLVAMQLADNSFGHEDLTDAAWTKLSVLNSLDPLLIYRKSNQIQSGIIFAIKSEKSQRIAKKWLNYCVDSNYSFLVGPSDTDSQSSEFKEHRYEQSIFSLIVKSERVLPLEDETWFSPDWTKGLSYPIWAMRNRSGGDVFRRNIFDKFKFFATKIESIIRSSYRNKSD
jgi:hypothetical protein